MGTMEKEGKEERGVVRYSFRTTEVEVLFRS